MTDAFDPVERYDTELRGIFEANARECFEDLLARSGVNPEENSRIVREYNEWTEKASDADRRHSAFGIGITIIMMQMRYLQAGVRKQQESILQMS